LSHNNKIHWEEDIFLRMEFVHSIVIDFIYNRGKRKKVLLEVQQGASEDPFPPFNPKKEVVVGHFVALNVEPKEVRGGVPFYMGKMWEFGQGQWALKMKVLWYWPAMKWGVEEEASSNRVRYSNCMEATWEPFGERLA